ncbi:DUF2723 domain-containing protein [Pedobacter sp. MC2016-24]|uniref:glycosyltransferase family 117 protein n=1 Tax=Pedobacter sp. MC2016-24 TaxID=2780090 RepID=UPI00187EE6DA|nr:DUF2723 domain-containing protein [Pedobacter sp. MC2016-24]MBE9598730.1 DUF2723 domain-containing protein [Pedobacter sp. MC2016-24]
MNNYKRINNLAGFTLFGIATLVYWLTMEPTASFWDCGEFISASDKLQVGHQPGAPLFLMIGKMFSLLAMGNTAKIAYWVNFSSVLASGATIMFLYWTITALASKLYPREKSIIQIMSIVAAGAIGALAYTFSDTFWFSAVESEVYALSTLFTAIVFWAILKWEENMDNRWLVLIAFLVGLSIGVHLLSLLAIPAVVLVYYFKKTSRPDFTGTLKAFAIGCLLVGIVQFGLVQYLVLFAAKSDLFFVNTLGFGFGSGAMAFIIALAIGLSAAIYYSVKHQKHRLNLGLLCLTFLLFGFSSYFMIVIRANAKPNINLSNPDNPYSLYGYLGRTNYGDTPLLYGKTFDAQQTEITETGTDYRKGKERYEVSGKDYKVAYDKNLFFPRTYSNKPNHPEFYKSWMGLAENETPGFLQTLSFFSSYQVGFMYWRYFMWNFSGRQSDIQGQGNLTQGNWITGVKPLDAIRLGNQSKLPPSISANEGHNAFYGLPLLLGVAGLIFLYRKNKQVTLVIATLFFFTGLAIILYLNQDPLQVRERDYAYVGSFYAFAIFIGFGMLAVKDLLSRYASARLSLIAASLICLLTVPVLMGSQGWDDHNRSDKYTALDWASNYLNSCAPNAILFTNADNDTYPLWYAQEVEGIRTDVRVVSLQFLGDGDYINQMKKQANLSAPLPISMTPDKYQKGVRDYLPYIDYGFKDSVELKDLLSVLTSDNKEDRVEMQGGSFENFLPTKNFKLSIDADQLVKTHTIDAKDQDKVVPQMEWNFNKNFASKSDLALFDILVNNKWERPIYFGSSLSEDTYIGLSKYLYLEGYAYRLLPFKKAENDKRDKSQVTNSEVMYSNTLHKLNFKGFNKAKYLDPESRRIAQDTWTFQNTLASNLIQEGKTEKAAQIMTKAVKELPMKLYTIQDTLNRLETIQNLYSLNDTNQANLLAKNTVSFLDQELNYIATLPQHQQRAALHEIQVGMYVLNGLNELTAKGGNLKLNEEIKQKYKQLENTFVGSLG